MSWIEEKPEVAGRILRLLYEHKMIRTFFRDRADGWTLVSGLYSPIYIQLRQLLSHPEVFIEVCSALAKMAKSEVPSLKKVVGIAMAGIPIASGMCYAGNFPGCFTRKMEGVQSVDHFREVIVQYGEHSLVEGEIENGDDIVLVDDLVTRFDSKLIAFEQIKHEIRTRRLKNVTCSNVVVILDPEQGASEAAEVSGFKIISLIPLKSVGMDLLKGTMHDSEWEVIKDYLNDPQAFQDRAVQKRLAEMSMNKSN